MVSQSEMPIAYFLYGFRVLAHASHSQNWSPDHDPNRKMKSRVSSVHVEEKDGTNKWGSARFTEINERLGHSPLHNPSEKMKLQIRNAHNRRRKWAE